MSNIQIIAIIIRLFSISLFVITLNALPQFISPLRYNVNILTYIHAAVLLSGFIISILIWIFPQTIAKKILPNENEVTEVKWNNDSIASTGIVVLGIFFLYRAISDFSYWFVFMLYAIGNNAPVKIEPLDKISIYVTIIEFALSIYLILGSRGITNLIMKFRGRLQ